MTANTPNRSYTYPQSTDHDRLWEHFQELATDIDTDVQAVADAARRSGVRLTQGTAQTGWTSGTYNTLTFGTEDFDWGTLHDSTTNTSRIVIGKKLGLWMVQGVFAAAANSAASNIRTRVTLNGAAINGSLASDPAPASAALAMLPSPVLFVVSTVSTDYVELQGLVTAGSGTIGSQVNGEARSSFSAVYLGIQ